MKDNQTIIADIERGLKGLKFQKQRILHEEAQPPSVVSPVHDVDFYMIILRRLYRILEKQAKNDPSVANLKGKYGHLHKNIKIRDHFEHTIDFSTFPRTPKGWKIITCLQITKNDPKIISGDKEWHLNKNHDEFIELMSHVLQILK